MNKIGAKHTTYYKVKFLNIDFPLLPLQGVHALLKP